MIRYLTLFILGYSVLPLCGQDSNLKIQIDRIIRFDTDIALEPTTGILVGVVDQDTSFVEVFGANQATLDDQSLFEIGSITKVMTANLVTVLLQDGLLDADASINDYLPQRYSNPRMEDVTVIDLMLHQAGLPRRPEGFGAKSQIILDPYRHYTRKDLLDYYHEFVPPKKQRFRYSHTAYALLELIIEQAVQMPFEEAMQQHVWEPAGLVHTRLSLPETKAITVPGHTFAGRETEAWSFASFAASEGVKSSLSDLMLYVQYLMRQDNALYSSLAPYLDTDLETDLGRRTYAGPGWQIVKSRKWYDILMHSGVTSGHHCYVNIVPETRTGVVVMCNNANGAQDLCFLVLRMINRNWDRRSIDG